MPHITLYYSVLLLLIQDYSLIAEKKKKGQKSKQSTSNAYQLISQILTKIYEAISYKHFSISS